MRRIEDGDDIAILELIGAAVMAGAYRDLAREFPASCGGFIKLADKSSRRVQALANGIVGEGEIGRAIPPSPIDATGEKRR